VPRFRRKAKGDLGSSDTADLSESEHAWWATGRVQHTYGFGPDATPPAETATETAAAAAAADTSAPTDFQPWTFDDVFAAKVDTEISADEQDPVGSFAPRDLAEVFVEEAAYRALGLQPGATWDDVVLAHRQIAKRFHPDRLVHADDAARTEGEEQMRCANAAYEELRQRQRRQLPTPPLFRT